MCREICNEICNETSNTQKMSTIHDEEQWTEMIVNHDGFILGKKRKIDSISASSSTIPPPPLMSEYTLNGRPLSKDDHETLVGDSKLYSSQIESGNDVLLSIVTTPHMMDILLTFFQHKTVAIREARERLIENEILWNKNFKHRKLKPVTTQMIFEWLILQRTPVKTYLETLPLKDLYDLIEVLNFFMSESFVFAVKAFRENMLANTRVVDGIANWLEERSPSILHVMEEEFLQWTSELCGVSNDTKIPAYPYRFTDEVWIMLKIEMFEYRLLKTLGGTFIGIGLMSIFRRVEPRTDFERLVTTQDRFVTEIAMMEEGQRLTEFNEFCLKLCKLTYSDGCTYEGGVYIHPIGGALRHGHGTLYEAHGRVIIQEGTWLFDGLHCEINVVCPCPLCNCEDEDADDEDDYGFSSDYMKCCFNKDKKEWNIVLDDDDHEINEYRYCSSCKTALEPIKRQIDEAFLQMSNDGEQFKTSIKHISTHKDFMALL